MTVYGPKSWKKFRYFAEYVPLISSPAENCLQYIKLSNKI